MSDKVYNVLFLCTGNSARSLIAEVLLNSMSKGRFKAYSAGSFPLGKVDPFTIALLARNGHATEGLRSKSWDEFATTGSPHMDLVITVCDNEAGKVCPLWPGQPVCGHWGFEDPAAAQGSDEQKREALHRVYQEIAQRLHLLLSLPLERLDHLALQQQVREIGARQL